MALAEVTIAPSNEAMKLQAATEIMVRIFGVQYISSRRSRCVSGGSLISSPYCPASRSRSDLSDLLHCQPIISLARILAAPDPWLQISFMSF